MTDVMCKIGIDLDNTIICYDKSFYNVGLQEGLIPKHVGSTKFRVKSYLTNLEGGQHQWETLQGMVYGKHIKKASIFPGVTRFIDTVCSDKRFEINIVSHKTKVAHHDPDQTNLRQAAICFLQEARVITPGRLTLDQVHFCDTLEEKVRTIARLNYQIFIDDLAKVFQHRGYPDGCRAILFRGENKYFECHANWNDIQNAVVT